MSKRNLLAAIAIFTALAVLLSIAAVAATSTKTKKKDPAISWMTDLNSGLAQAKKSHKPIMVDFYADWCGPCKKMGSETFTNAQVVDVSHNFIPVRLNVDKNQDLAKKYKVQGIPNVVFFNSSGKEIDRSVGFKSAADFVKVMKEALSKAK